MKKSLIYFCIVLLSTFMLLGSPAGYQKLFIVFGFCAVIGPSGLITYLFFPKWRSKQESPEEMKKRFDDFKKRQAENSYKK